MEYKNIGNSQQEFPRAPLTRTIHPVISTFNVDPLASETGVHHFLPVGKFTRVTVLIFQYLEIFLAVES